MESLFSSCSNDAFFNVKASRRQNDREGDPETAVGREGSSTESVSNSHFPIAVSKNWTTTQRSHEEYIPHASKKLYKTSVAKGQGKNKVVLLQPSCSQVDQTEDEGGQGEGGETQWSGIGEFSVLDSLVKTRLEFTTKSYGVFQSVLAFKIHMVEYITPGSAPPSSFVRKCANGP